MSKRKEGRETLQRLLKWDKDSTASERLSAIILEHEGFKDIDPSHPQGGKDGKKDIVCNYNGVKYIAGCYFPRGQQTMKIIKSKFKADYEGVNKNNSQGFIFITNQELILSQRSVLEDLVEKEIKILIIHLETLALILNTTVMYGVRLEFLDIEMNREEQFAHHSYTNNQILDLTIKIIKISEKFEGRVQSGPEYVHPIVSDQVIQAFPDKHHICSICNYGYIVISSSYSLALSSFSSSYISCPKCGNTEIEY